MSKNKLFHATLMPDDDWWHELWSDPLTVLKQVDIKPHNSILDLCCGNGHFTQAMCQLVTEGQVWALDMENELLSETEKSCQSYPLFQAIHDDAMNLDQHFNNTLDRVFMANTFHGVPEKTELSKQVYNALKPQGCFIIVNWQPIPRELTPVLGVARGPDTELRMAPETVQDLVEPSGLQLEQIVEIKPYHYASLFYKN